jgi:hypothetical protein
MSRTASFDKSALQSSAVYVKSMIFLFSPIILNELMGEMQINVDE